MKAYFFDFVKSSGTLIKYFFDQVIEVTNVNFDNYYVAKANGFDFSIRFEQF